MTLLSNLRYHAAYAFLLIAAFAMTSLGSAQLPPQGQPKHYAWSDTSLSPDVRADLVIKELTLEEKISLLHGQGGFGPSAGPRSPMAEPAGRSGFRVWVFLPFRWRTQPMA